MTAGFYLLDHPKASGPDYYKTRLKPVVAYVVHITAGLEDLDYTDDHSAEATAEYAATTSRDVSWHLGTDTDTTVHLLPWTYTAWHCRDYNSSTIGHEISKYETNWTTSDPIWVRRTLTQAAAAARPILTAAGIPIRHASRAEVDHAIATGGPPVGLVGHTELNPDTRRDPGRVGNVDTFPWATFLGLIEGDQEDVMKQGDTGEDVVFLTARLDALGVQVTVKSVYDAEVTAAVRAFQQLPQVGVKPTGEVGLMTAVALGLMTAAKEYQALVGDEARKRAAADDQLFDDQVSGKQARRWHDRQHR